MRPNGCGHSVPNTVCLATCANLLCRACVETVASLLELVIMQHLPAIVSGLELVGDERVRETVYIA